MRRASEEGQDTPRTAKASRRGVAHTHKVWAFRGMKTTICKCGEELHPVRIKYGYNTCVPCSTVERYGCAPVINHKTGNSIQVLSRADAERIAKLTRRKGYGTMLR
jgi:hypothetical protein